MRLLLHVGLNKCASSFIQSRLNSNADALAEAGVFYPREPVGKGHYSISKHYGFGPDKNEMVEARSVAAVACLARERKADALILSSEYLSLNRPDGIARLVADIDSEGFDAPEVLFFARPIEAWVRSLFNQYIRSIDGGKWLHSIDDYVDQALKNGALNIAARFRAWEAAVGPDQIRLIDVEPGAPTEMVLQPFERFAGIKLAAGRDLRVNHSIPAGVLHILGLVRRAPSSPARNELLQTLFNLDPKLARAIPAPPGYDQISEDRLARLACEIEEPFAALPRAPAETAPPQAEMA